MNNETSHQSTDNFASMYEASLSKMESLKPGQLVETNIVSISKDCIFLELSGKSEGIIDKAELSDENGKVSVKEGDPIKAFFLEAKNGEMRFTTRISGDKAGSAVLENAFHNKIPVEGVVEKEIKGGYEVKIGASRAFCPYSHMGFKRPQNQESSSYVGKHLTFSILEYKDGGKKILVSNKVIEEEAYNEHVETMKKTLKENMVVNGIVKSIQDFGAFVDINGIQALLPISEISFTRVEDISAVLSEGQKIEVEILKLDWKNDRITLSLKALLSDPWDTAFEKYPKNSKHKGRVVRTTNYGAFIELEPGLDGLIHISELKADSTYTDIKKDQELFVQILSVDVDQKRISLKPTTSLEEDATSKKYLESSSSSSDTYNPFAALLKKKD
ncbi:MAG TPA: S1 RNA-binding domain-containing protein [Treponemataceae bacterium]|nr:S1 RNA-binding domain-containing protein [Treponemataceae bacterium]